MFWLTRAGPKGLTGDLGISPPPLRPITGSKGDPGTPGFAGLPGQPGLAGLPGLDQVLYF